MLGEELSELLGAAAPKDEPDVSSGDGGDRAGSAGGDSPELAGRRAGPAGLGPGQRWGQSPLKHGGARPRSGQSGARVPWRRSGQSREHICIVHLRLRDAQAE